MVNSAVSRWVREYVLLVHQHARYGRLSRPNSMSAAHTGYPPPPPFMSPKIEIGLRPRRGAWTPSATRALVLVECGVCFVPLFEPVTTETLIPSEILEAQEMRIAPDSSSRVRRCCGVWSTMGERGAEVRKSAQERGRGLCPLKDQGGVAPDCPVFLQLLSSLFTSAVKLLRREEALR